MRRIRVLIAMALLVTACGGAEVPDSDPTADLLARSLQVLAGPSDGELIGMEADESRPLGVGETISVDDAGEGLLTFSDHLVVRVFRDTELEIEGMADPDAPPWAELQLSAGTVLADLDFAELAEQRLAIRTGAATVISIGTKFLVHVDPGSQATWVIVREGVVEVIGEGGTEDVAAGFATWVLPGQAPQEPFSATREAIGERLPPMAALTNDVLDDEAVLVEAGTGAGSGDGGEFAGAAGDLIFEVDLSGDLVARADELRSAVGADPVTFATVRVDNGGEDPVTVDSVRAAAGGAAVDFEPAARVVRELRSAVALYDTATFETATALLDEVEGRSAVPPGQVVEQLFAVDGEVQELRGVELLGSMGRVEMTAG